jgi:hypothetical protein
MQWVRFGAYFLFGWLALAALLTGLFLIFIARDPASVEQEMGMPAWLSCLLCTLPLALLGYLMSAFERRDGCFLWLVGLVAFSILCNNIVTAVSSFLRDEIMTFLLGSVSCLLPLLLLRSAHAGGKTDQIVKRLFPDDPKASDKFDTGRSPWAPPPRLLFLGFRIIAVYFLSIAVAGAVLAILRGNLMHSWASIPVAALLGVLFWRHFRRTKIRDPQLIRKIDTRPPILFLRSFDDDRLPGDQLRFTIGPEALLRFEHELAQMLWNWGPVIAIGQPGKANPHAGAAREYLGDNDWQRRVTELLNECALVVVVLGSTTGLLWELHAILAAQAAHKVVLAIPPVDANEISKRLHSCERELSEIFQTLQTAAIHTALLVAHHRSNEVLVFKSDDRAMRSYRAALGLVPVIQ